MILQEGGPGGGGSFAAHHEVYNLYLGLVTRMHKSGDGDFQVKTGNGGKFDFQLIYWYISTLHYHSYG